MKEKILIAVVILVAVIVLSPIILIVLWSGGVAWSNAHPSMGENVARVDWLPASASNVSFYITHMFRAYEFDIPEDHFVALAPGRNWKLSEINENGWRVSTYRMGRKMREKYDLPISDLSTEAEMAEYRRAQQIMEPSVTNGLVYEVRYGNGGGITVVYDRTKQRGYVQSNPR
jgi:hypothetical protein